MISQLHKLSLLMFLFSAADLLIFHVESYHFSNVTDQEALLAIKSQLADPFGVLSSWNNTLHFCHWFGVKCASRHQRVAHLNLTSLRLAGQLSPHIGNLTFLRFIDLGNNDLHGSIPQEVGRLHRLAHLILWNNSFQGEIPQNLTQCSALNLIQLNGNRLAGKIPDWLGSLSGIYVLDISSNNFVGNIPPSIGNLSSLIELSLASNFLQGSIPAELGQLSILDFFQVSSNNLSGIVPKLLYNISSITFLSLDENQLHGQLPTDLCSSLPNLQGFYVPLNHFSGPIPATLTNCSSLVDLDLGSNAFTGTLPDNLGLLKNLESVGFGSNKIQGDLSFLNSLTNCTQLSYISVYNNQLNGVLPSSIVNFSTNLSVLVVSRNHIYGGIPWEIGNLIGLRAIQLSHTMLSGKIPDSIGRISELQEIYATNNKLFGEIPSSIGNMSRLGILDLQDNFLQGAIPVSLGNCVHLQEIDLSHNHFSGVISKEILAISSLSSGLFLASNDLTGTLPEEISNLKNLNWLDISNNKLSGRIPSALESCQVLETLNLSGNFFQGTIPSLTKQRGIRVLDLSRNNLSGHIPEFLGELSLTHLNLSFNNFEGEVPTDGVFKNASAFSILGNKKLCGGIKELKLATCPKNALKHKKHSPQTVLIAASVLIFIIIILSMCCAVIRYQSRRLKKKLPVSSLWENNDHPRLSFADLFKATDGFSSTNLIGMGRYGSVFKGLLDDEEKTVAVKVFNLREQEANKTFIAECKALRTIRHRNLVKVITCCSSIDFQGNDFKALVFEFMSNGSLHSWLHPCSSDLHHLRGLNLVQRLGIAIDIASAVHYLHTQHDEPVVHGDLKPSNIFLDGDLSAHVGDFGLTKLLSSVEKNSIQGQSSSIGVRGTVGYIAPEYGMGEEASTSGDMYSFGILLMELFTGKSPTDEVFAGDFGLHEYVKTSLPDGINEIVDPLALEGDLDPNVKREKVMECLASIFRIGVECSAHQPRERMDSFLVLIELEKLRNILLKVGRGGRREQ